MSITFLKRRGKIVLRRFTTERLLANLKITCQNWTNWLTLKIQMLSLMMTFIWSWRRPFRHRVMKLMTLLIELISCINTHSNFHGCSWSSLKIFSRANLIIYLEVSNKIFVELRRKWKKMAGKKSQIWFEQVLLLAHQINWKMYS